MSACMADSDAPVKHTSDAPQFGRSQIRTWLPRLGQRLRQLPNAGEVLAEPAARCDRPGPTLADDLVRDGDVVDGCMRHGATLISTSMLDNGTLVVDADSHWCEPPDLFTRRGARRVQGPRAAGGGGRRPADVGVRRPRRSAGPAPAASSAATARRRAPTSGSTSGRSTTIHVGAYDPKVRLEVLDECGIDAQIIFPSTIGLGGQDLGMVDDQALCRLAIEIYNDRHGRDPGRLGQPAAAAAADAGVGHRHLRRRGQAGRRRSARAA